VNFKVFPATINSEGQKVPLIKGWNENASNDPAQIKAWQDTWGSHLKGFGVPCGEVNGIFVLDVDVKKSNGFESLKGFTNGWPQTLGQKTPSGGYHFIFRNRPGIHSPNTVNSKLSLDTRGDRGWIMWYGNTYGGYIDLPIADAPDWLYSLTEKPKQDPTIGPQSIIKIAPEIAQQIFQSCIDNIINAPPGESNNVLNIEAYKAGQLVASGSVSREFAEQELFKAAKDRGKPDYESKATICSGLDGGAKNPLLSPFGSKPPDLLIQVPAQLPEPPGLPERWTPGQLSREDLLASRHLRRPQLFTDWSSRDITITTADGGVGKTTLKLYEAVCLALGDYFLGFNCVSPGKTLFITGEDTDKKLAAMLGTIMKQMGLFDGTAENNNKIDTILKSILIKKDADLCLIAKDRQNFLFPNQMALDKVLQAVQDFGPSMIVFDPISSFWGSESALNDMNKAVTRFMSSLVEKGDCCVEMINHMGKSSSASKDMTQFAGRGGSGLPSNSRISRVLISLSNEEYQEKTGQDLLADQSAMLCNVNKYTDGSPLLNKPFIILRTGFLFKRINLSPAKLKEMENQLSTIEKVFEFIQDCRIKGLYPTSHVVCGHFQTCSDPMSKDKVMTALRMIEFQGHNGFKVTSMDNPDLTKREKVLIITDMEGVEIGVKT